MLAKAHQNRIRGKRDGLLIVSSAGGRLCKHRLLWRKCYHEYPMVAHLRSEFESRPTVLFFVYRLVVFTAVLGKWLQSEPALEMVRLS